MTPAQLKALFRSDTRDEDPTSPLWSDTEIFVYMDDAQKTFCRETGGIADSTSAMCTIPVTAGQATAVYDPRILKLRDLRRASDGRNVALLNFENLGGTGISCDDYGQGLLWGGSIKLTDEQGLVYAAVTDMDANTIRLINVPIESSSLQAVVYRMPLEDITAASTAFEIASHHHRYLLNWMKHLGHEKQDAETYDRGRSIEFRQKFLEYCDQSKAERERREHKYRAVAYGGY